MNHGSSRFGTRRGMIAVSVAALALAGCANSETDSSKKVDTATGVEAPASTVVASTSAQAEPASDGITFTDGYVKAKPADKNMTAIFGVLSNEGATDKQIVGFSTSLGQASYEIHEVVDGVMKEKEGGITLPAGASVTLAPGNDHFMIMNYSEPIAAGDEVSMTLKFADGISETVSNIPVRTIAAGEENYGGNGVVANTGMSEAAAPSTTHQHG